MYNEETMTRPTVGPWRSNGRSVWGPDNQPIAYCGSSIGRDVECAAMVQVAAWQKKYPKGLAKGGGRNIVVDSWTGEEERYGSLILVNRKIHFDSRKAR